MKGPFPLVQVVTAEVICLPAIQQRLLEKMLLCPWDDMACFLQGCMTLGTPFVTGAIHSHCTECTPSECLCKKRFKWWKATHHSERQDVDGQLWPMRDWNTPPQPETLSSVLTFKKKVNAETIFKTLWNCSSFLALAAISCLKMIWLNYFNCMLIRGIRGKQDNFRCTHYTFSPF